MNWSNFNYNALTDEQLQAFATNIFGKILKPLSEIGRDAVIKELKAYDRFEEYRNKKIKFKDLPIVF